MKEKNEREVIRPVEAVGGKQAKIPTLKLKATFLFSHFLKFTKNRTYIFRLFDRFFFFLFPYIDQ